MKKIMLIILLFCSVLLIGCSNNKVITFVLNEYGLTYEYKKEIVVTKELVESLFCEEIESLYYDQEFTNKYNNEVINENIKLYIKTKQITITFNYETYQEKIEVNRGYIVSFEDLSYVKEEYLEGIYKTRHYYSKYENDPIEKDTTFYIKTKKIRLKILCDSILHEIQLYIGSVVDKMVLARLGISYIQNLYVDKECTKLYDGSILEDDTLLYTSLDNLHNAISMMKEQLVINYNSIYDSIITKEKITIQEYYYYDEETTVVKFNYDSYPKNRQNKVMTLAGYMFLQKGNMIRVFKNNQMYELKEAYEQGIIDDQILKKIYFANDSYGINQETIIDGPFTNELLIVLNKKGTFSFKEYTVDDFKEYGVISLKEITEETMKIVKDKYLYDIDRDGYAVNISDDYRRMIIITLSTTDSYEILKIVKQLSLRDDIMGVGVNYAR